MQFAHNPAPPDRNLLRPGCEDQCAVLHARPEGRFRSFDRATLSKRGENLDISWLKDENASNQDELPEPDVIAAMIRERLATAMEEMDTLSALLETSEIE